MKQSLRKITALFLIFTSIWGIVACSNSGNYNTDAGNNSDSNVTQLVKNIMDNIQQWETVSDSFSQEYTYDAVSACGIRLFSYGVQNAYYFVVIYAVNSGRNETTLYNRIYYLTSTAFEYLGNDGNLVGNNRYLGETSIDRNDLENNIKELIESALQVEQDHFDEIYLYPNEVIELTEEEQKLFNNMYATIIELEYKSNSDDKQLQLIEIYYYDLGGGNCEVLFDYGSNIVLPNGSIYNGDISISGYSINNQGYSELSDSQMQKLMNKTSKISFDWNVAWSAEKKQYMLKQAIHD